MINLKSLATAHRFRVTLDESDRGEPRSERPWLYQIPAKFGHVFVQGADTLGVYCRTTQLRRKLLAIPGLKILQDGDREFSATFQPDQLDNVAAIIKCRKRRVLSDEQRANLAVRAQTGLRKILDARSRVAPCERQKNPECPDVSRDV